MEIKILWSDTALAQLEEIFELYIIDTRQNPKKMEGLKE